MPRSERNTQTIPSFCFLGFFLIVSFSTSLSLSGTSLDDALIAQTDIPFDSLVKMIFFFVVACLSARLTPLYQKKTILVASAIALSLAALLTISTRMQAGMIAEGLYVFGSILLGAGTVPLYLSWMEIYAKMDMRHVLIYFTAAHLLSSFLSFLMTQIASSLLVSFAIIAFPIISVLLLLVSGRRISDVSFAQGESITSGWTFPLKPVVLFAGFTLCNNFLRGFLTGVGRGYALFGVMVVSALLLAFIMVRFQRFSIRSLYYISLPLAVAGALCTLINLTNSDVVGALLTNGAYALFSIFVTAVLCNMAFRYGVNPLWTFGFTHSALTLATLVSRSIHEGLFGTLHNGTVFTLCICLLTLLMVILFVVFLSDKDFDSTWGMTLHTDSKRLPDTRRTTEEKASSIARIQGLTRREEEILVMLLEDKTISAIEDALFISNSTAKTHLRHIYKKLNVHSKQELIEQSETMGPQRHK